MCQPLGETLAWLDSLHMLVTSPFCPQFWKFSSCANSRGQGPGRGPSQQGCLTCSKWCCPEGQAVALRGVCLPILVISPFVPCVRPSSHVRRVTSALRLMSHFNFSVAWGPNVHKTWLPLPLP